VSNSTDNSVMTRDEEQLDLFAANARAESLEPDDWQMRVSSRARNLRIQVYPHGAVEVVIPRRARPEDIRAFVEEHTEWVSKTRASFLEQRPPELTLPENIELTAVNETIRVHYRKSTLNRAAEKNGLLTLLYHELAAELDRLGALRRHSRHHGLSGGVDVLDDFHDRSSLLSRPS